MRKTIFLSLITGLCLILSGCATPLVRYREISKSTLPPLPYIVQVSRGKEFQEVLAKSNVFKEVSYFNGDLDLRCKENINLRHRGDIVPLVSYVVSLSSLGIIPTQSTSLELNCVVSLVDNISGTTVFHETYKESGYGIKSNASSDYNFENVKTQIISKLRYNLAIRFVEDFIKKRDDIQSNIIIRRGQFFLNEKNIFEAMSYLENPPSYVKENTSYKELYAKLIPLKNKADILLAQARQYYDHKEWTKVVSIYEELIKIYPSVIDDYAYGEIYDLSKRHLEAEDCVNKAKQFISKNDFLLALNWYRKYEECGVDYPEGAQLKSLIEKEGYQQYLLSGDRLLSNKKFIQAMLEYKKCSVLQPHNKEAENRFREAKDGLFKLYSSEAKELIERNLLGNALLNYMKIMVVDQENKDILERTHEIVSKVRDRNKLYINFGEFTDYTGTAGLKDSFLDGIFNYFFNNIGFVKIPENKNKVDLVIEGAIYPLKIEAATRAFNEHEKVLAGTEKIPNPRRQELVSQINALQLALSQYEGQAAQQTQNTFWSVLGALYSLNNPQPTDIDGVNVLKGAVDLGTQSNIGGNINDIRNRLGQLHQQLESEPEYIENKNYIDLASKNMNVKDVFFKVQIKIKEYNSNNVVFSKSFEDFMTHSKNLPSDIEIERDTTEKMVREVSGAIENFIKDYGLNYCRLGNQYSQQGMEKEAVEKYCDFLESYTAKLYPLNLNSAAEYIMTLVDKNIPAQIREDSVENTFNLIFPNLGITTIYGEKQTNDNLSSASFSQRNPIRMAKGTLKKGMTFSEVELVIGVPKWKEKVRSGREAWVYPSEKESLYIYFDSGKISEWTTQSH